MFNFCVITGWISNKPTRRFYGKDHPITEFEITILFASHHAGHVTVLCPNELSLKALLYVDKGHLVAVCGYLSGDAWRGRDGTWKTLHLVATELAVLDPETLSRERDEGLLT